MAATEHPLKRLVSLCINDVAAWLLNCPVRETQPLNVELPADVLATDQVCRVTLADGCDLVTRRPPAPCSTTFHSPW